MFVHYTDYIQYRQEGISYAVLEFFNQQIILVWKITGVHSAGVYASVWF